MYIKCTYMKRLAQGWLIHVHVHGTCMHKCTCTCTLYLQCTARAACIYMYTYIHNVHACTFMHMQDDTATTVKYKGVHFGNLHSLRTQFRGTCIYMYTCTCTSTCDPRALHCNFANIMYSTCTCMCSVPCGCKIGPMRLLHQPR